MITRPFNDQTVTELDPHVLVGFNLGRIHNANKFMKEQLVFVSVCTRVILIVGANTVRTQTIKKKTAKDNLEKLQKTIYEI